MSDTYDLFVRPSLPREPGRTVQEQDAAHLRAMDDITLYQTLRARLNVSRCNRRDNDDPGIVRAEVALEERGRKDLIAAAWGSVREEAREERERNRRAVRELDATAKSRTEQGR